MNKIICGDALTELKKLDKESVDLILTSPPYWEQRKYTEGDPREIGCEKDIVDYLSSLEMVFDECLRVCKRTGSIVFNLGDKYIKGDQQLIPYRFAIRMKDRHYPALKLINDITWVKTNPTPRQYKKRLISATEPFFHFVKYEHMFYYNQEAFFEEDKPAKSKVTPKKGKGYATKIQNSDLSPKEKLNALIALTKTVQEVRDGEITDFRMKIRGVHKKAFGGQPGGRNNQIDKKGFTVIKMHGCKLKRDVIINSVANTKDIDHPAVFPLKVIMELIKLLSEEDNVVLDPFCGSGQVCVAAKLLNRKYLGIELKKEHCELSENRISEIESLI
jgi:site-specific DNA-methyltransferase (adenine-specific)